MKKKLFFLPFVAALALTGCSEDILDNGENGNGSEANNPQYLAINIVTTPNGGSRAAEGTQYGDLYEDGTSEENEVKMVRFYFFDDNGNGVSVNNATNKSYFDWIVPDGGDYGSGTDHPNDGACQDEKVLNAVVVIETANTGKLPTKVLAVVNPSVRTLTSEKPTLTTLSDAAYDYAAMANGTYVVENVSQPKNFVMSNSVYVKGGKDITTTTIKASDFFAKRDDALSHPIQIHVERTVAKVRVNSTLSTIDKTVNGETVKLLKLTAKPKAGETTGEEIKVDGQNVYLKINGWNLTRTLGLAYLIKHVDATWPSTFFPESNEPWNDPDHFRSFWAQMCTKNGNGNKYFDFNNAGEYALGGKVYAQENAQHENGSFKNESTMVIFSGTLCKEDGTPLTVVEYAGSRMIGEDALKDTYLTMLKIGGEHTHYWLDDSETDASKKFKEISRDDIMFLTADEAKKKGLINDFTLGQDRGAYKVYACLTDAAANRQWYTEATADGSKKEDASAIQRHLTSQGPSKVWKGGNTYYFKVIGHIGTSSGVVRNHIYEMNLNAIYGLGTPVYKPEEIIYPEQPSRDESYVAAQVRILSWRVITNPVELDWGN